MRRREFISLISGATVWPLAARAQQSERERRIGVLMNRTIDNPEGQARLAAFKEALQQLNWNDGHNVRIDTRWGEDDMDLERKYAAELVALAPDILLASGTLSVAAIQHVSHTLPIVFVGVTDPVGAGLVESLAQPGGSVTGFMIYEYSFGGKRLELLKQIAPSVTRAAVLRDPANAAAGAEFAAIQTVAQSLRMDVSPIDSRGDVGMIERSVAAFARLPNGGLILTPNAAVSARANLIVTLAAQHNLPAIYPFRYVASAGGLISYGPDVIEQCRHAASYVDRILRGEKPADLPVQTPTKYELVINLKTAKALGLAVPAPLLTRADEVIE
jgi:putative tryptophan/tyrosine transport system substrate-binding protein